MYCKYCGAKLKDEHADCPKCGKNNRLNSNDDAKDFRFALLGFLVPIAGLVLYLVWKKDSPHAVILLHQGHGSRGFVIRLSARLYYTVFCFRRGILKFKIFA